jgi:hypothetical protein
MRLIIPAAYALSQGKRTPGLGTSDKLTRSIPFQGELPMRPVVLAFALSLAILPSVGRAADEPLEPLGWLVGGTWVAEIKPPKGDPLAVHMTVQWSAHKQSVLYTITFKSKESSIAQYEGMYYWHPAAKEIRLLQVDRGGQVTEGVTTIADSKWTQRNTLNRKDGTKQEQRTELVRDGDDSFKFRAFLPKGDEWVEGLNLVYKRVKETPHGKK